MPFGEYSQRLYPLKTGIIPFLAFWYRFVAPLASDLQFSDPTAVYAAHVAPRLADYIGRSVFEEICGQWLQGHAKQRLGLTVRRMAIPGCASVHARRAACTSSRSYSLACRVFFEGEIPLVQLVPQSANLDRNALRG